MAEHGPDSAIRMDTDYVFDDEHFTFTEMANVAGVKHNPKVFEGRYISLTLRDDGTLSPNFKMLALMTADFSVERYAKGVYEELRKALLHYEKLLVSAKNLKAFSKTLFPRTADIQDVYMPQYIGKKTK